jgi:hypothetical protein
MKKGSEWYQYLSDKEKMKFKSNCFDTKFSGLMEDKYESFRSFIGSCFGWVTSPEGWEYWDDISKRKL